MQALRRGAAARRSFLQLRAAAVALQAAARGRRQRASFLAARSAAVCIQAAWRGCRQRLHARRQQVLPSVEERTYRAFGALSKLISIRIRFNRHHDALDCRCCAAAHLSDQSCLQACYLMTSR